MELKKTKHNTHLHIYKYADVPLSPGERHAACAKAKKSTSQRSLTHTGH